jgi:DNA invertase Pin-like site-specific DNA recombinase
MAKQELAVALCRVSSLEQLQNNSLRHQKDNVLREAEKLGVVFPQDHPTNGIWAGQVSSKVGVNFNRKDLVEMFNYCKTKPGVKYLIVQEVDRFMRSPDEQTYWYVRFWYELKVKVWYADKPELNEDTHVASLLRYMEGWRAGGTNVERMTKSINGQTAALKEGRYPFAPKPGYIAGVRCGVQEPHPLKASVLKEILIKIATRQIDPSKALVELNESKFMQGRTPYKMDKFRKIVTDPFYAGIVEIDKQVKVRNENGLHEPLITKGQHYELLRIMDKKGKNQIGPRKNGNPKYPCNNIVNCDFCLDSPIGRVVGFDHSNGKNKSVIYEKYRCRSCGRYITRSELHNQIEEHFERYILSQDSIEELVKSLDIVWRQRDEHYEQESNRIAHKINDLNLAITQQVEAATDPSNTVIKDEILKAIDAKKSEIKTLEDRLFDIQTESKMHKEEFLRFALEFMNNLGRSFLELPPDDRLKCKDIIFPAGFHLNKNKKVYTPEISPLYRLATNKKDAEASQKSLMVRVMRL